MGEKFFYAVFVQAIEVNTLNNKYFDKNDFKGSIRIMIEKYVKGHKLSQTTHEEVTAMIHSNHEVATYFYKREVEITDSIKDFFIECGIKDNNLEEKVHVMIGMIDNLCHELIYHKHEDMNYDTMTDIVINSIYELFKNDLV